jgi:anti-sigma factor RsiW
MNRDQAREKLSALIDGELEAREELEIRRMIDGDEALRSEFEQLRLLRQGLESSLTPPAVSDSEWEDVALRIVSQGSERLGWLLFAPGSLALVVGALAFFFMSESVPLWVRGCSGAVVAGLTFLLLTALADRIRASRVERYDRVQR